jgi:hypothetical protein
VFDDIVIAVGNAGAGAGLVGFVTLGPDFAVVVDCGGDSEGEGDCVIIPVITSLHMHCLSREQGPKADLF